ANIMKEAEKQGMKVLWVGGVGFGNARLAENTGEASEGAIHNATYDKDAETEMNQSYVRRLLAKVPNETPHWPAANCYDAMKMLAQAIKQANVTNTPKTLEVDRKRVREALATIKDFPALTSADGKITIVDTIDGKHAGDAIKKGTLIQVQGRPLEHLKYHERVRLGMSRTFQNIRLFSQMTVLENVMIGRHCRTHAGLLRMFFRLRPLPEERAIRARADEILEFIGLSHRRDAIATTIPFGEQRRLEIARALSTDPDLLLLYEPTAGMNPRETEEIDEVIKKIRALGKT